MTRCCDRKSKKQRTFGCQKCTLIFLTILCCGAIGGGLYGNDDLHNGLVQVFNAGKQLNRLFISVRNQTSYLSRGLKDRAVLDIDDLYEVKVSNETALNHMMDVAQLAVKNITEAISGIDAAIYFINPSQSDELLQKIIDKFEFYELLRWPITLGFLTFLLFLCTVLVIGVARSSRCLLIFFSVLGLFTVAICWLLSGIYLATSVAAADFCMAPYQHFCAQQRLQYIYQSNCGASGTNHFVIRLGNSRENLELAKRSLYQLEDIGKRIFPSHDVPGRISHLYKIIDNGASALANLTELLDSRAIQIHYNSAARSLCHGGLFGLALMMIATIATAFLLTILVCVDSHTWIYLTKKRPFEDKAESAPLFPPSTSSMSPSVPAPISSGTATINRTLLHSQQYTSHTMGHHHGAPHAHARNGAARGLASLNGDSPPPTYDDVHDISLQRLSERSGHQTLGRLPSHSAHLSGPNNGKYATLSDKGKDEHDPRDVTCANFNRFDPKYQQQHIQLQQHHLQKPNNQQLELQTYQLQQSFQQQQQQSQSQPNYSTISTVSRDYNQQTYPTASLPYKKPGTGFSETSSILKKHRDEINEMSKPNTSVFSIETSSHRQDHAPPPTKSISIINQPLPEIPTQQSSSSKNPQVLCAANLTSNYPTNYRSLQRPQPTKSSYPSGTTQRQQRDRESRPAVPAKVMPPVLPPKSRTQNSLSRAQQPLPAIPSHQQSYQHHQQQQQQYPSSRNYERERSRDRERNIGRSYDDSHQYRTSSKQQQQQQQQNFQTLPHHHHHPHQTTFSGGSNTGIKSRKSRELLQQPFENYSATEL
ncbi:hypothetical protein PVAND_002634 [Polypedilum vanderplanki]|uniref:Protein tweety homolog n=1 Tax=Polypedilum vanderplanki TaxID=319348 RepID=A0A9J6BT70_POLVA|nr:hypothetical protein PVAND_002634 [Polypedilum vanderplanki]